MAKKKKLPSHIAVIMDGNGRWAKKRNLPRIWGHREGAKSVRETTETCAKLGIKYLTLYAFSTENWKRPKKEINFLMKLLEEYLEKEKETMLKNNIALEAIGDISKLPGPVRRKIASVKKATSKNSGMTLVLALNYGSRKEIINGVRKIAKEAACGKINPSKINEKNFKKYLYTKKIPDPDFLIRTSGEMRVSNYLLWQIAYSEIYVTKTLWPDCRKKQLRAALAEYGNRERRYGGV